MAQNAPKWSGMFSQMVQMRQEIPTPNYLTQKIAKQIPKNGQNDLKMAKNDSKCFFKVIFIDNLKSGLQSEGFN